MEIFPANFLDTYHIDGHSIKYFHFIEIAQGGPEVGRVTLSGVEGQTRVLCKVVFDSAQTDNYEWEHPRVCLRVAAE